MKPFLHTRPHDLDIDLLLRLYDPVELAIVFDWLGMERPPQLASAVLDWTADGTTPADPAAKDTVGHPIRLMPTMDGDTGSELSFSNAVARLVLSAIQDRLPQWAVSMEFGQPIFGRDITAKRAAHVEPLPRHLFTINWADSGPGYSWPEAYYATPLPGFDCLVITASEDSPDAYGYADLAIGTGPVGVPIAESAGPVIKSWWTMQANEWNQQRWEYFWHADEIDSSYADAWADEAWPCSDTSEW